MVIQCLSTTFINQEDIQLQVKIKTDGDMQQTRLIIPRYIILRIRIGCNVLTVWGTVTSNEYMLFNLIVLVCNNFQLDKTFRKSWRKMKLCVNYR